MTAARRAARAHDYGMWVPVLLCAESHISLARRCFLTVRPSNSEGFSQYRRQASGCDLDHALGKPDWNWSDEFCPRSLATVVRKKALAAEATRAFLLCCTRMYEIRGGHGWPRAKIRCLAVSYDPQEVGRAAEAMDGRERPRTWFKLDKKRSGVSP